MTQSEPPIDVIIVGGGPAGSSAALVLGRARRRVVLFDHGQYRNAAARKMHGFLTRDGADPKELRRIAREELARYDDVAIRDAEVVDARRCEDGRLEVTTGDGTTEKARKIVIATGLVDELPAVEGFARFYGAGVHHCPYCDGYELRDRPLAVYGKGDDKGAGLSLELLLWSRDVVLCSDGPPELSARCEEKLRRHGVPIRTERIVRLEGDDRLERIVFESGPPLERAAIFFNTGARQRSDLPRRLGCETDERGSWVLEERCGKTKVPGVYVVGDASRDVLQVIVAAAEGAEAAIMINRELLVEDGLLD